MEVSNTESGYSLAEMAVVVAIAGLIAGIAVPQTLAALQRQALRGAVMAVSRTMLAAQAEAETLSTERAVKFVQEDDGWSLAVYEDGNGNGVHTDEIASGVDRRVGGVMEMPRQGAVAWIGLPDDPVDDPDTGRPLGAGDPVVEFNRSTMCSFSPAGRSTPGTVFLTNGRDAAMVRASGATGALQIHWYDRAQRKWV